MEEPLPPGAEEEGITAPGMEPEAAPGAEQAPGVEAAADGQGWATSQAPVSGAADYGYQYANYGAQYTDPAYEYQAYYNSYYYPQGQGYGAQPDAASGYYTGYDGYQQPYQQQETQPEASAGPVSAPAASTSDQPPGTPTAVPSSVPPAAPSSEAQTQPPADDAQPLQESFVMGDSVQVVSLTDEQRAAAEQQRQALEAARLAAEAQVQREQLERRRREEERLRERNLAAQRAAQAAAVKPKDTGPTPETLAEIQQKLEEAAILAAKHTAAASEEAAKKEAEANALAKKKGMPTLQGAKLAFVKPGIMAPAKRQDSTDAGASPGVAAAESADRDEKAKQEAHRALIMQRLAAMKAVRAGGSINDAVAPPAPQPDSARRRQSSRSPSRSSISRSASPPPRRRHAKAPPGPRSGSPDDSRRRYRGSPVRPHRRDSFQQAAPGRRPDSGQGFGTGRPAYDQQAAVPAGKNHPHGHRDSSRRHAGHERAYDEYNGYGNQEYADEGEADGRKEKRRKEKRRHRHRRPEQEAVVEYGNAYAEEPPRAARPLRQPRPDPANYADYYNDQDQIAAPVAPPIALPRVQPIAAAHVAVQPAPVQAPAFVPQPAFLAAPPSKAGPAPAPASAMAMGVPEIKGPPKLAELRARAAGVAAPTAARPGSPSSGSESRSPSPAPPPARVAPPQLVPQPQARQPAPVQQPPQQYLHAPQQQQQQQQQPSYQPAQQYPVQPQQQYQPVQPPQQQYQPVQPPQQQVQHAPPPQQQQYQPAAAWPGQAPEPVQQQGSGGGSGFLPAQVKEAAAAAMARRQAEQQQQQQQQASQRASHLPLQERVSDVPVASPNYPPPGLTQPQQEGRPARRSRRRSVADSYDEYDREYAEQPHAPAAPADQEGYSSEGGRRHRRQHKKRRKEAGSSKHRPVEPVRERKGSHKRSRRRSPTPSPSPEPPAARPGSARPNGWPRDQRRPGYFQHDDRATPPAEPGRRGSLRSGSRRRRSYSQSRSPSGSRSGSYSRSRSPRRARSPSPASKAAAAAEAEARAQKLAQDVARAAAAARLAADANNSLAATRPARKIYVGSLPVASSEAEITHFFNQMMAAANAATPHMPALPVVSCYINHEKRFAFVEFRTVEEASNAMALDGLGYRGEVLRIRRPSDYNSMTMAHLGPTQPSAAVNAGLINLSGLASGAAKALPSTGGEQAAAEQQAPAAPAPPPATPSAASVPDSNAVQAPPVAPMPQAEPGELPTAAAVLQAPAHVVAAGQTKVLRLANMVKREELATEEEYEDIKDDIYWEIHDKFGAISSIVIPRPAAQLEQDPPGVGLVFLAFEDASLATAAQAGLHRRKFGDSRADAVLYDQQLFDNGTYQ